MVDLYKRMDDILETFDFDRVMIAMEALDWKYSSSSGSTRPTLHDLRDMAARMMISAIELFEKAGRPPNGTYCASGGFIAVVHVFSSGRADLQLMFAVADDL